MRRNATVVVVALVVAITAAVAWGGRPVSLVGRVPTLGIGETWRATLRAPRAPALIARQGGRSLRFGTMRIAPRRYAAAIRLPRPGRWTLTARLGAKRYALGSVRVIVRRYRLEVPAQLIANPDGSLLVAERGLRNRITRIDPVTGQVSAFSTVPGEPYGLTWAGRRLLVTTRAGIYAVAAHGGPARQLNGAHAGPLVPETESTAFYGEETEIGRIELGSGAKHPFTTTVANPHTLLLAANGRLIVTDTGNGRILSVDPPSGAATTIASGLDTPLGMTLDGSGDLIVGEHNRGTLVRVKPDGSTSVLASGLRKPYSIVTAGDGNYYVAEVGDLNSPTGELRRISPQGTVSTVRLHH